MRVTTVTTPDEMEAARFLVRSYFHSWGLEEIDDPELLAELDELGPRYAPPDGTLLICTIDAEPAGVVGFRRHDERSCVMKRMFVQPEFRRRGVARVLALELLRSAERLGYTRMVLDTPSDNARAIELYRLIGFTPAEPYVEPGHGHTHEGWSFWELELPPDDETWFRWTKELLETAYLSTDNIYEQSGNTAGTAERWNMTRIVVADCIDREGSFLDVGCANGLMMESVARWCADKGLKVEPYGLDISQKLAQRARERLPEWADRIFVGNAWTWEPPQRFDLVATRAGDYTPPKHRRAFIQRLLDEFVAPGGRLILHWGGIGDGRGKPWAAILRDWGFTISGSAERRDQNGEPVSRALRLDRR
ncbi:MAG: GNAT family N-acetyltransferase [Actinomycetota bacterium]